MGRFFLDFKSVLDIVKIYGKFTFVYWCHKITRTDEAKLIITQKTSLRVATKRSQSHFYNHSEKAISVHRRSLEGLGAALPSIEIPPMIKVTTTKPIVSCFF